MCVISLSSLSGHLLYLHKHAFRCLCDHFVLDLKIVEGLCPSTRQQFVLGKKSRKCQLRLHHRESESRTITWSCSKRLEGDR